MLEAIVHWLADTIFRLGYPGIAALMALESSFFPFPSEVVMPPAGYLAAQGRMHPLLALGAGVLGSLVGAAFNYFLAVWMGRPLLHKYHRFLLMRESSLDRAEAFFRRHGEVSTFVGRLIPVIRQLISLPAGIARMRLDRFLFYTGLGAGIWCAVLTYIGWYVGRNSHVVAGIDSVLENPEMHALAGKAALVIVPFLVVIVAVYILWQRRRRPAGADGVGNHQ